MSHWFKAFELSDTFSNALFNHLAKKFLTDFGDIELKLELAMASEMKPEMEPKKEFEVRRNKTDENEIELQN